MKRERPMPGVRRVYHRDTAYARACRIRRARRRRRARRLTAAGTLLAVLSLLAGSVCWMLAGSGQNDLPANAAPPVSAPPAASPEASSPEESTSDDEEQDGAVAVVPTPAPIPTPAGDTPEQAAARAELDAYLDTLPGSVSVLAVRPSDGLIYARDADKQYYAASLLKAPYALWLYARVAAGELDLNETLPGWTRMEEVLQSEEDLAAGLPAPTPRLVTAPERTARAAVYSMVSQSNNAAAEQLYTRWPATAATGFADFLTGLGLDMTGRVTNLSPATGMSGTLSASDGVRFLTALQAFFDTGTADAAELKQAFLDAGHSYLTSEWPMAKKYGNWNSALHDIAIVYAPDPYYAAVFTDWGDPAKIDPQYKEYYRQISTRLTALMES